MSLRGEIPVVGDLAAQRMTIALGSNRYLLEFYFNFREACWYMDILTDPDTPLVVGVKLVPDWPLIGHFQIEGMPVGEITAEDTSGQGLIGGRDDFGFGRRVKLYYEEA